MEDQLITSKTIKLAKERGFPFTKKAVVAPFIQKEVEGGVQMYCKGITLNGEEIPTQSLLKKWFREVHSISIKIDDFYTDGKIRYDYSIINLGSQDDNPQGIFISYEEALEEALQEALKSIKL